MTIAGTEFVSESCALIGQHNDAVLLSILGHADMSRSGVGSNCPE